MIHTRHKAVECEVCAAQQEADTVGAMPTAGHEAGGEPELRIVSGGESLDIFETMQRFRTDGSCEQLIKRALEKFADTETPQPAGEPSDEDVEKEKHDVG